MFTGTNIENISYGATICAERVAIYKYVTEEITKIKLLTIISDYEGYIYPCVFVGRFYQNFQMSLQNNMLYQ